MALAVDAAAIFNTLPRIGLAEHLARRLRLEPRKRLHHV
jgi:hypothetical protein